MLQPGRGLRLGFNPSGGPGAVAEEGFGLGEDLLHEDVEVLLFYSALAQGEEAQEDERQDVALVVGGLDVAAQGDGSVPELLVEVSAGDGLGRVGFFLGGGALRGEVSVESSSGRRGEAKH